MNRDQKSRDVIRSMVVSSFCLLLLLCPFNRVQASGGEEMEGSRLEEYLEEGKRENYFGEFGEMDYALFLETNVGYAVTMDYFRYGVYGDFQERAEEGEETYFTLYQKLFGRELRLATYTEWCETESLWSEEDWNYIQHKKWAESEEELLTNVSTDLEWLVTRKQKRDCSIIKEKWYQGREEVRAYDNDLDGIRRFQQGRAEEGGYEPLSEKSIEETEKKLKQIYDNRIREWEEKWMSIGGGGRLLACVVMNENDIGTGIDIYQIGEEEPRLLYQMGELETEGEWPMEVSQIEGDEESGFVIFSYGDSTYRMNYPEGSMEKLGEFMYRTTYSPDGKYLSYCTGNNFLYDFWEVLDGSNQQYIEMRERWDVIPPGWYVREVASGKEAYIPIERWELDDRPLYGGRCVWIEKEKLLGILGY